MAKNQTPSAAADKQSLNYPLVSDTWGDEELEAIQAIIASNRYSMGKQVKVFEEQFARAFGTKFAVCVNSGSSANMVALAALFFKNGLKRGDEIIVPAIGWSTTYAPLFYLGLVPIFVDVNPDSFNIDVEQIEQRITPRTRAILTVNLLGKSCDYGVLNDICEKYGLALIEDNCEAMGARFNGKYCGSFGLAGTFSFFFSHHITTIEGGMITTNDEVFYNICCSIRAHGWVRSIDDNRLSHEYPFDDDFRRMFWFILPGFNVRPTEFTGAIGQRQLIKFPELLKNRLRNHAHFHDRMNDCKLFSTQKNDPGHSAFSFPFVLRKEWRAEISIAPIRNQLMSHGIELRPIAGGDITKQPFLRHFDCEIAEQFPNAEDIDQNGFMIGNHCVDIRENIDRVFGLIDSFD